ncbi:hypothetical protein [Micromonospora sp. NPDC050200]
MRYGDMLDIPGPGRAGELSAKLRQRDYDVTRDDEISKAQRQRISPAA